jgi:hypothetical protein
MVFEIGARIAHLIVAAGEHFIVDFNHFECLLQPSEVPPFSMPSRKRDLPIQSLKLQMSAVRRTIAMACPIKADADMHGPFMLKPAGQSPVR